MSATPQPVQEPKPQPVQEPKPEPAAVAVDLSIQPALWYDILTRNGDWIGDLCDPANTIRRHRDPQPTITIKSGDRTWIVHKNVIMHGSEFFKKFFEGDCEESKSQVLDMSDKMPADALGNFISAAYGAAMLGESFSLTGYHPPFLNDTSLSTKIKLWRASNYFQHEQLRRASGTGFDADLTRERKMLYSGTFTKHSEAEQVASVKSFVDAYNTSDKLEECTAKQCFLKSIISTIAIFACDKAIEMFVQHGSPGMLALLVVRLAKQLHLDRQSRKQAIDDASAAAAADAAAAVHASYSKNANINANNGNKWRPH
ncbi:hypothetical protein ACHAQA_004360 [Verticillium albo-atrum]